MTRALLLTGPFDGLKDAATAVTNWFGERAGDVSNWVSSATENIDVGANIFESINDQFKKMLSDAIVGLVNTLSSDVQTMSGNAATELSKSPNQFAGGTVFTVVQNLHTNIVIPIAGVILTFILCYQLIEMVTEGNRNEYDAAMIFKWCFYACIGIMLVSNAWKICMGLFDVGTWIVSKANDVIGATANPDISSAASNIDSELSAMSTGSMIGYLLITAVMLLFIKIINIAVMLIVILRMFEIYVYCSVAAIPVATIPNRAWRPLGEGYIRGVFALAFQGFFMMLAFGMYEAMVASYISSADNFLLSVGNSVLMGFVLVAALWKSGSMSKAIFNAR